VNTNATPPSSANPPTMLFLRTMTVEDIEEAILRLPPAELAKFRAWFAEFEAGRVNKKSEPEDTASRLGRIAGRTFADLRKRWREP
jgi:hypothetical protein